MRKSYAAMLLGAASWAALSSAATAKDLFVFGDSLSDNGNYAETVGPWGDAYYPARFSTGPVWVEQLGFNLGRAPGLVTLKPATSGYNRGFDFAHAAATANIAGFDLSTGVENNFYAQANFFKQNVRNGKIKVDYDDIAIVYFGTNDLLSFNNSTVAQTAAAVKTHSRTVLDQGVRNMLVLGMPDWGAAPVGSLWGNNPAQIAIRAAEYNALLPTTITNLRKETGKNVGFVDVDGLFKDMINNKRRYGFTVTTMSPTSMGSCIDDGYTYQTCPEGYMFADGLHLSARSNRIFANFVYAKTNGLFAGQTNAQTANQSVAILETVLITAVQDLFDRIFGVSSMSSYGLAEPAHNGARGYSVMLTSEGGEQPSWMSDSDDRYALMGRAMPVSENLTVGFASMIGQGENADNYGSSKIAGGAGFAAWREGDWTLAVNGSSQSSRNKVFRETGFEFYPVVKAEFDSRTDMAAFSASRTFSLGGWTVAPAAELVATRVTAQGYSEQNAPAIIAETIDARNEDGLAAGAKLTVARQWRDLDGGGWTLALAGTARTAVSGAPRELVDAPLPEVARELANLEGDAGWVRADVERTLASGWAMGLSAAGAQSSTGAEALSARLKLQKRF